MSMDIYARKGQKVIVSKVTAHNGYDSDKKKVEEELQIGKIYNISSTSVSQSSTSIMLEQFPNKMWNSVMFIDYVNKPLEVDFKEVISLGAIGDNEVILNKEAYDFAVRKWNRENGEQIKARSMYKEGVIKLSESEMMVTDIRAYGKDINSCLRHKKDMVISYQKKGSSTTFDLFLTKDQAEFLYEEMRAILNVKY